MIRQIDYWVVASGANSGTDFLIDTYTLYVKVFDKKMTKTYIAPVDFDLEAAKLFAKIIKLL